MTLIFFRFFTILCCVTSSSFGARILGVFPWSSPSHFILGSTYLKSLAEAGHDVTMISAHQDKNPPKNGKFRIIHLTGFLEYLDEQIDDFDFYSTTSFSAWNNMMNQIPNHDVLIEMADKTLNHTNVQNLLKSDEQFDIVVVEQLFMDPVKALAYHYNAIQIVFVTVGTGSFIDHVVANPSPYAYVPDMELGIPPRMNFLQRVENTIVRTYNTLILNYYALPKQDAVLRKYFPNAPSMDEIIKNVSLVVLNSHPSLNDPVPHVPAMVEIGGFHISPPKQLPKDLQEFLDNSKDGVVYFSMGSTLTSNKLPIEKREALLNTFGKLKVNVLWKWEDDVLPNQPSNVKLGKWLPQQDILAHPNVKVFITHGGLLSTTEAVYHGVPVLTIPIFGDQKLNANLANQNGIGLTIDFQDLSEEELTLKLKDLLENPKYTENVKTRSKILKDREISPRETAVFWTEYVLRHKGAPHLRVAGVDLPLHQYLLLDVVAFLLFIFLSVIYILKIIFVKLCRKIGKKIKMD